MDKVQQMGASRPEHHNEDHRQARVQTSAPSGQQQGQQTDRAAQQGQMQATQFTDWASI